MIVPTIKPHLIAHRGWSKRFPENSIPAFAAAIVAGADEIEFDVRVSKDGVPFVIHDATIDRTTDGSGKVSELTALELKRVHLKGIDGEILVGLGIPTLQEVLENVYGRVGLNIHIKGIDDRRTPLHLLASLTPVMPHRFYIAGSQEVLEAALEVCPHIPRCFIQAPQDIPDSMIQTAAALHCERIQFFKGYYETKDVQACLEEGIIPNLYWADELEEAETAIKNGVLGLLTNDIGPVRNHLFS